jgi:hypothetical protein
MKQSTPMAARIASTTISRDSNQSLDSPRSSITWSAPIPRIKKARPHQSTESVSWPPSWAGSGTSRHVRTPASKPRGRLM